MEKRDVAIVVAALAIVLFVGLIGKPLATGQPIDLGIPLPGHHSPQTVPITVNASPTNVSSTHVLNATTQATMKRVTPTTTPITPPPTPWRGEPLQVGITPNTTSPLGNNISFTKFPDNQTMNNTLLSYAVISGRVSGSTAAIPMPFPYWELHYSVTPWNETYREYIGSARTQSIAEVTGSQIFPSFQVDVVDAAHPDDIIRTISPPGGLDLPLWTGNTSQNSTFSSRSNNENTTTNTSWFVDPRPWVEKFYEGTETRSYIFVIRSHMVQNYSLDIMVPSRYLGVY